MTKPVNLSLFADFLDSSGYANPSAFSDQENTSTSALGFPMGSTAQRNASPADGYLSLIHI